MKVILFIRDPIERAWSKIKMNLLSHRGRALEELSYEEFKRYSEGVRSKWVPYEETIAIWQRYFPQVHVSLFDDLKNNQEKWYQEICRFLDISVSETNKYRDLVVNEGKKVDIPNKFLDVLIEQYINELSELDKKYPDLGWSKKYT